MNDLTVFIITVGDKKSLDECERCLSKQSITFRIEKIENVAPMGAAFQEMSRKCLTPFYIQVDEDMMLQTDAIERLYNRIKNSDSKVAFSCGGLFDTDAQMPLYGIKVNRTNIAKQVLYDNDLASDIGYNERLSNLGYKIDMIPLKEVFGTHAPFHTPYSIYKRWYRLILKHRKYGKMKWAMNKIPWLHNRWKQSDNVLHLYAMLGAIAALSERSLNDIPGDDFRDRISSFDEMIKVWPC